MTDNQDKIQIYNVVILDKSGSMGNMRKAAVDGFNETLNGIKKAQQEYKDTQDHFITLALFCDCGIENVYDNVSVKDVPELTMEDFEPCCNTPLMDAIGKTLTDVESHVKDIEDSLVVVTIITDGHENSSRQYNNEQVRKLIDRLKEKRWSFTFIGANQDSFAVARSLSIDQARNFVASSSGMSKMQRLQGSQNRRLFTKLNDIKTCERKTKRMSAVEREEQYKAVSKEAYDEASESSSSSPSAPPTRRSPRRSSSDSSSSSSPISSVFSSDSRRIPRNRNRRRVASPSSSSSDSSN